MKTAMQELIQYANELDFGGWEDVFIQKATELLEKEKEQIVDAYENGVGDENERNLSGKFTNAEEYYNQTYKQKEKQKQNIINIMEADENDGLYNQK